MSDKVTQLERRLQAAKKDALYAASSKAEFEAQLNSAKKELDRLRDALARKEDIHKKETEKLRESVVRSEQELKKQLAAASSLLVLEQAKVKDLERACCETQDRAMMQIAELAKGLKRDDKSEQLLVARDKIVKSEQQISNLKADLNQLKLDHAAEVTRLQHAIESCHKDLSLVILEKNEKERLVTSADNKLREKNAELEESRRMLAKSDEKHQAAMDKNQRLCQTIEELKVENASLEEKDSRAAANCEKAARALKEEQRRSAAYKDKAIQAHRRSVKAKEVLDSLCSPDKKF